MNTETVSLHGTWRFQPVGQTVTSPITIPSQWSHGQCWGFPPEWAQIEQAWCSRNVSVPSAWVGCHVSIRFDAVLLQAEVFADDAPLGTHTGGFTPFEVDVSHLAGRTFELRVRVSSVQAVMPSDRFVWQVSYPQNKEEGPIARGIWQNVWLVARPRVHVAHWRHVTRLQDGLIDVEAWVANTAATPFDGTLSMALRQGPYAVADPDFLRPLRVQVAPHAVAR
ncbi:MAG: sugar-binding domain-containing protein, partial [Phycisphaerae bacterium]